MKKIKYFSLNIAVLLVYCTIVLTGCDRELSDDVKPATFPATAEVFIDGFSGGLEYRPFAGSKFDAFTVDTETFYQGSASMRFDVPNVGDPDGGFAGAIFPDNGGRDLSGFDALTFWAKGTDARTINEIGFGQDFGENKFQAEVNGALQITTGWKKYIFPLPDPSKLTEEKGMFWYAEGPSDDGTGWTFWVDELQFEKLGTVAQPRPAIFNGEAITTESFIGVDQTVSGLTQTFNLGDGTNQTMTITPSYFTFESSNEGVATVNELGVVSISSTGTAVITATLGGVRAAGSLTIQSVGEFSFAPIPPARDPADVISLFSDAYTNVPVDYYNGFFLDGFQTTLGGTGPGGADISVNGDGIINYTLLNFVAIGTFMNVSSVNATDMTHLHVDIQVKETVDAGDYIRFELLNSVGVGETSGSVQIGSAAFLENEWVSLDIPLDDFGLASRSQLGLLFFISDNTISDILVDNIYYYR